MKILLFLRTMMVYFLVGLVVFCTVPILIILLVTGSLVRSQVVNKAVYRMLSFFYQGVLWALQVPITVEGREYIRPEIPSIIIANHQSAIDIMLVGALCGKHPHLWYAWAHYARMPVLGFFVRRLGAPLETEDSASAAHGLLRGMRIIRQCNCHVIIFPEGARFVDEEIHEFLRGFILLARDTNRPIIPVYMPYNARVYPPKSFFVYHHQLCVIVGEPMMYDAEAETSEQCAERIRGWFVAQHEHLK